MIKAFLFVTSMFLLVGCGDSGTFHKYVDCVLIGKNCPVNQDQFDDMVEIIEEQTNDIEDLDNRLDALEAARQNELVVTEVIDPCGDRAGSLDEVLLDTNQGVMAWYSGLGLTLLEDGNYRTTDRQRCSFSIVNGEYVK